MSFSVDIIVICKDDLPGLTKTVNSINNQNYKNFLVHIVDGSNCDEILQFLENINDQNFDWTSEPDDGIYFAMNKGLDRCRLDFCLFLNAGDVLHNGFSLESAMDLIDDPDKLYFGRTVIINDNRVVNWIPSLSAVEVDKWLINNFPCHPAIFFPRKFYVKNRYDIYLKITSDHDFKIRALRECDHDFIDVIISDFYLGGVSSNTNLKNVYYRFRERISLNIKYTNNSIVLIVIKAFIISTVKWVLKGPLSVVKRKL